MSRTLARLRSVTDDPLLVRAGRGLVPTPRAAELRDRVHALARETRAILSPRTDRLDIATLERTFTIRANEGFVALFSASLVAAARFELPVRTPEIVISAMWHPRMDADPAHRWLRNTLIGVCRGTTNAGER
ncbi:MAG TPA: hypothetical protein VGC30_15875 [Dokdonella sp.]